VRGGTAILLPERVPDGPARRLFGGEWNEELVAEPRRAGPLLASELLRPRTVSPTSLAIAPTIVAAARGHGRIIVSGAMDAWRHRDADSAAFDTFWRSLVSEGAIQGQRLRVDFEDSIARIGTRHSFLVRYRSMTTEPALTASAVVRCAATARMVRLWPTGSSGTFRGELPVDQGESCTVEANVNDAHATAAVATAVAPARVSAGVLEKFVRAARASGGVVTDEDNRAAVQALNEGTAQLTELRAHVMRSPWWIVPFAGLLSIEWWLRRRAGLR
jgi:hypothetical protein